MYYASCSRFSESQTSIYNYKQKMATISAYTLRLMKLYHYILLCVSKYNMLDTSFFTAFSNILLMPHYNAMLCSIIMILICNIKLFIVVIGALYGRYFIRILGIQLYKVCINDSNKTIYFTSILKQKKKKTKCM